MQCGARKKSDGRPCPTPAMPNGKCRMHGGKVPVGYGLPQTKHGRYSRYIPERLAARYEEAQSDGELISVREDLALVDARISDLLSRVDTREAGTLWQGIGRALQACQDAPDPVKRDEAIAAAVALSSEGQADYRAWAEVLDLVERRRKLAETEAKRLTAMGQAITAERAMVLLAVVVDTIRRHVTDREVLSSISRDLGKLVDLRADPKA